MSPRPSAPSQRAVTRRLTRRYVLALGTIALLSILGQVVLYDDTYTAVGNSGVIRGSASSGNVSFTSSISYQLHGAGVEEGVVAFYPTYQNNVALSSQAILVKVFLAS